MRPPPLRAATELRAGYAPLLNQLPIGVSEEMIDETDTHDGLILTESFIPAGTSSSGTSSPLSSLADT